MVVDVVWRLVFVVDMRIYLGAAHYACRRELAGRHLRSDCLFSAEERSPIER